MNLSKLFETQHALDERITKEKGLEGQDLLPMKILALQVELGELANEWRGFKFWSEDRKPVTEVSTGICIFCGGTGNAFYDDDEAEWEDCSNCEGGETVKNPLLEEYVGCLHFILSIGLELNCTPNKSSVSKIAVAFNGDKITIQFRTIYRYVANLDWCNKADKELYYSAVLSNFVGLGEMLGFTWEQIEQAYYAKNQINHERQATGY